MSQHLQTDLRDGVLTLTLARVDKKNSFTNEMYTSASELLDSGANDPKVRVVLFAGLGDMFSAGNDMSEFLALAEGRFEGAWQVFRFLRSLASFPKPVVAAVQGRAVGIGTTLLLHCDQVILADNALLSTPFVNLALSPEAASSGLLPDLIGHRRAFSMFALGQAVDAKSAVEWGLANEVVPKGDLSAKAFEAAHRLAKQPLGSLVTTKALMRDVPDLIARIDKEEIEMNRRLQSAEAREAFKAFGERRAPDFSKFS